MDFIIVSCPHCNQHIMIYFKEFNCKIFRHGIFKDSHQQIDPHLSKIECDNLVRNNLIYGCGKPFRLKDDLSTEICGYI